MKSVCVVPAACAVWREASELERTCLTPFPKSSGNLLFRFGQVALLTTLVIPAHQPELCKYRVSYGLEFVGASIQRLLLNTMCDGHMLFGIVTNAGLTSSCTVPCCL